MNYLTADSSDKWNKLHFTEKFRFSKNHIFINTQSGDENNHPLAWLPKLLNPKKKKEKTLKYLPFGIQWPKIYEFLSFEVFNTYIK